VEDQLLFDPSKSYFVDPGSRTSDFQMAVVDVESVNSAARGQTVQFLLPRSSTQYHCPVQREREQRMLDDEIAAERQRCIEGGGESKGRAASAVVFLRVSR